jgi:hypothetical protein
MPDREGKTFRFIGFKGEELRDNPETADYSNEIDLTVYLTHRSNLRMEFYAGWMGFSLRTL